MKQGNLNLKKLNQKVIRCRKCPRLSTYIRQIARQKTKRFSGQKYWAKPLPSFGDPNSQILVVGLAPAAHGGNRTGRMFTGDSSGDWVARVLFDNGLATKPTSQSLDDGFSLINCYITASVRCAPPDNKPTRQEMQNCSCYLEQEIRYLQNVQVIVCLGRIAFESICRVFDLKKAKFSHGNVIKLPNCFILCSYHPSRQNTQTGRLQWSQWNQIFVKAKDLLDN
jgi:uracil-DNA glycosylase family 4